jgi:hypothetical protein
MGKPGPLAIHKANQRSGVLIRDTGLALHYATGFGSCSCGEKFTDTIRSSQPAERARTKLFAHIEAALVKDPGNGMSRTPVIMIGGCEVTAQFDRDGCLNVSVLVGGADDDIKTQNGLASMVPVRVNTKAESVSLAP